MELLACIFNSEDKSQFSIVRKILAIFKNSEQTDKKEIDPRFEFL